ncbi:POK25 protein, partial [Menura novaehollandiae]|nr:POK25 protein [Menura novaehollandiae]
LAARRHVLQAIAALGKPDQIKTDNGPAYRSQAFNQFLASWAIVHLTSVPYNSTGQAVVERYHRT